MAETYPHVRVNECMPDTPSRCRCGAGLNNAYYFFDAKTWGENCPAAFHDALARVETKRDRLQAILDAETGKSGPDGWLWTPHDTWSRYATLGAPGPSASVWRHADMNGVEWSWRIDRDRRGTAKTALEAMEAADLAVKESK